MTSSATTLPPPLSDAPSVETLQRLLVGLHEPMQRGVPSPPSQAQSVDVCMFEPDAPATDTAVAVPVTEPSAPAPSPPAAARDLAPAVVPASPAPVQTGPLPLSWSAAHGHRGRWTPAATALGLAVVTAAGVVAGLVVAGEVALP